MPGLLRICTAGSVDDGKSTLIGRLLYDSQAVYEDQVKSVQAATRNKTAGPIDFSLFTDGLRAEREQGITIDVAYRYFATARRKFILADTPGHEQYTRNMATGASTADVAILLVDARHGVKEQTRRHARIAHLLGISSFILAVNKMDLMDFDQRRVRIHLRRLRRTGRRSDRYANPDERPARRQRDRAKRTHALVHRAEPARASRDRRRRAPARGRAVPDAGAARPAARPGISWLFRPDCLGDDSPRRQDYGVALGLDEHGCAHRDLGRGSRRRAGADVDHARARRRARHQPRRRARGRVDPTAPACVGQRRLDGRTSARSGPRLSAETQHARRDRRSRSRAGAERDRHA